MRFSRATLFSLALIGLSACSKSTPVEPGIEVTYAVSVRFANADGKATILRAQLFFDGDLLASLYSQGTAESVLNASESPEAVIRGGGHTVAVKILSQTVSPSPYVLADLTVTTVTKDHTSSESLWPGIVQTATLQTGDAIQFSYR